jgi:hypothetical protein
MELMLYFDGELDGELNGELDEARAAEIEAYLERDSGYRNKLSGLRVTSGVVREKALAAAPSFDIVAAVMSKIEAGEDATPAKEPKKDGAIDIRSARRPAREASKPANDNTRSIFTLAAIAVAAAAGMMIWGRMGADQLQSAKYSAPEVTDVAAPSEPAKPPPSEPAPESAPAPAPEIDMEHGVEVAAVDFGAHMGTIFYVPTGAAVSSATTTVVWVDDEVAGGK